MTNTLPVVSKRVLSLAILGASFIFTSQAIAQVNQQTGVADPGRAGERISEQKLVPQGGPRIKVNSVALQNAPAGAENVKFDFGGLRLQGANQYSEDQLYPMYADKIGQKISLADLYAIANKITLKYRNDGYILSQVIVPPQTIESGVANLQIVEGYINNIQIQGDTQSDSEIELIKQYASYINDASALNIKEMERQLLLINDLPGVNARTIISPSPEASGAADMIIIVERDTFEATAGVDNYGSRFLGPLQLNGSTTFNSLLGLNEQVTLQAVVAPDAGAELAFGGIGYKQPVGRWGTNIIAGASITDTDPGFTLEQFQVKGLSKNLTIGAEHPFIRSRDVNLIGRALFDLRNVDSKNNVQATVKDRIRAIRVGMQADFLDRLLGVAVNTIDMEVSQGVDILGASDKGDANLTRSLGDPTFTKYNVQLQRLQRITSSVNVLLSGRAQLANNPLLSSEEFGLGGISTVRGYEPSETVGDDGIAGKVEVQWNNADRKVQVYTFLDSGTVWNQDANNSAAKRNSLTSAGLGVRLDLPMDIDAEFIAAQPLHRDVSSRGNRDPQFFFSVNKAF